MTRNPSGDGGRGGLRVARRRGWPIVLAIMCSGCSAPVDGADGEQEVRHQPTEPEVQVLARSPQLDTFPCVELCHFEHEPNPTRRNLAEFHSLRSIQHGASMHWCSFCHQIKDLDYLRLLDGRQIPFDQAYRVCGQCHGDKLRDFNVGIHGLETGYWEGGAILRRSCPACHDPHSPTRPLFEALPPPRHPDERADVEIEGTLDEASDAEGSHD